MAPTPKRTYPQPRIVEPMPEAFARRPACHTLWAAALAQDWALAEANNPRPHWGRAATHAEGTRELLKTLGYLTFSDPRPGELEALARHLGFDWDADEERWLAPLLIGIR